MPKSPQRIPRPQNTYKEAPRAYPDLPKPNIQRQDSSQLRSNQTPKNLPLTPQKNVTTTPKSELIKNLRNSHQASAPRPKVTTPQQPQKVTEKKRLTLNLESTDQTQFVKKHVLTFKSNLYKLVGSLNVIEQIFLNLHGLETSQSDKKYDTIMDKVLVKFSQVLENFVVDLFFSDHFQLIERVHSICYHKAEVNFKDLVSKQIKNVLASDFKEIFIKQEQEKKTEVKEEKKEEVPRQKSVKSFKSKTMESTAPADVSAKHTPSKRGSRIGAADQIREAIFAARKENLKRGSYNVPKRSSDEDELFSQEIKIPQQGQEIQNHNQNQIDIARELTESYYSMAEEDPKHQISAREREKTASPKKRPGQDRKDIENKVDKFPEMMNISKKPQPNLDVRKKLDFDDEKIESERQRERFSVDRERQMREEEMEDKYRKQGAVKRPSHIPKQMEESYFKTKPITNNVIKQPEFTPSKSDAQSHKVEEMKEKLSALVNQKTPSAPKNCARFSPAPSRNSHNDTNSISQHQRMISDLIALPDHLQNIQQEKVQKNEDPNTKRREEELKKYQKPPIEEDDDDDEENLIRVDVQANHHSKNIKTLLEKKKNKCRSPYENFKSPYKDQTMGIPTSIQGSPEYKTDSFKHSGINLLKYGSDFVNSDVQKTPENGKNRSKTRKQDGIVNDWTSMINEKEEDELTLGDKSIVEPHNGYADDNYNDKNGGSFVSPNKSMKSYLEENDMRNFGPDYSAKRKKKRSREELEDKENRHSGSSEKYKKGSKSSSKRAVYGGLQTPEKKKLDDINIPEHTYRSDSMAEEDKVRVTKTKTKIVEDLIESFTKEVEMEIMGKTEDERVQISFTEKELAVRKKYKDEYDDINKFSFLPKNMDKKYLKSPNEEKKDTSSTLDRRVNYDGNATSRRPSKHTTDVSPMRGWRDSANNVTPGRLENVREKISIMGTSGNTGRPYNYNQRDTTTTTGIYSKLNSGTGTGTGTGTGNLSRSPYGNNIGSSVTGHSAYSRNLSSVVPGLKNLTGYSNTSRFGNYGNIYNPSSITSRHNRTRTMDENNLSSYRASSSYKKSSEYKKPDPMKYRIVNGKVEYLNK